MRPNPFRSGLFWFVVLGLAIFVFNARSRHRDDVIVVDAGVTSRIAAQWQAQMQRPPTSEELDGLVRDWIDEEIWYREARRLELDEGDTIVRRRLVQKIQFIAEQPAATAPDEATLRQYFEQHSLDYSLPERYSFAQVFFRDKSAAEDLPAALQQGKDWRALGAPSMLSATYSLRSEREIATAFGESFASSLAELPSSPDWQGPVRSEFGWHWVRLDERRSSELPPFEEVRERVESDYAYRAREQARQRYLEGLKAHVDVEWRQR